MKQKKIVSLLLGITIAISVLAGCGNQQTGEKTEAKEKVTVAFWGNQLQESYGKYLCDTFPDVGRI